MTKTLDITHYTPAFHIKIEGTELNPETSRRIASVTVTKKIGQADNFSFKVQDQLENGKPKLLGDKRFKLGNKISISIGYRALPDDFFKMQGHIEVVQPQFSEGLASTFEVAGKDKSLTRLAEESGYKCYTKKKDSDIVKSIAGEVGLSPQVEATSNPPPEKKEKKSGTSFLFFIKKMVQQNLGFEFFVSDGKLVFRKAKTKDPPVKELKWGKHLHSFEPRQDLSRIITGVTVRWWDEKKQEPIIGKAGVNDETPVGSGKTAGKIAKEVYGDIEKTITDEPVDSQSEAKNIAISILCDTNKEFVTAEGKAIGTPEIEPGAIIEIKEIGEDFSGKYYITAATHTIDTESYITEFSLRRNTKK